MTSHRNSSAHPAAADIRRIVAAAKAKGLIAAPGEKLRTEKQTQTPHEAGVSVWLDIDPETAERFLETNENNRPISKDTVTAYAREMAAGAWLKTHQGIAFNDSEKLIDGQHRLLAIVESGATVPMMVTYNLATRPEGQTQTTMDVVDRGRARSVGSQLKIAHGMKHGTKIASIAVKIATICQPVRARRMTVRQTLAIYEEFKPAIDFLCESKAKPRFGGPAIAGAFAFAMTQLDNHDAELEEIISYWPINTAEIEPGLAIEKLVQFVASDDYLLINKGTERALSELVLQALYFDNIGYRVESLEHGTEGHKHFCELNQSRVDRVQKLFQVKQELEEIAG